MKKILAITLSLLCFISVKAQLKELSPSKVVKIGSFYDMVGSATAELNCIVLENDTTYSILYKNQKYQAITDIQYISFKSNQGELGLLYKIFKDAFSDENKSNKNYRKEFKLGSEFIILTRHNGMKNWVHVSADKGYFYMKEKHVDLLFGKTS